MITIQGIPEESFGDAEMVSHFIEILASGMVTVYNAMQPDKEVITPHPGLLVFLFVVIWILLVQDIADSGIIMPELFSQDKPCQRKSVCFS